MMCFNKKDVLVTGGCGVVGRELITKLVNLGANVRCVDFADLPTELKDLNIEFYKLDLADRKSQFLFRFNPEYVFHLAADFERSEETFEFWDSNFNNNVLASRNLLSKLINCSNLKKIVFASSYLVYDKNLYKYDETCLKESDRINPRNLCGIAKLQTETDLNFLNNTKGIDVVSARIFRVYGKGSRDIISRWVESIINNEVIEVFNENNSFDYIYAEDVASGLLCMCSNKLKNKVYNLGTGKSTSIESVVGILKEKLKNVKIEKSNKEIFPERSGANMDSLYKETGWQAQYNIARGLDKVIEGTSLK